MTRNATRYHVAVAGVEVATRSEKAAAIRLAEDAVTAEAGKEVTVTTTAGTEVFRHDPTPAARPHFAPWTRVDEADFLEQLDVPAGYVVAYTRNRIKAAAARHEGREGWKILQLQEDGTTRVFDAVNTKEGQQVFNELRAAQLRAREEVAATE